LELLVRVAPLVPLVHLDLLAPVAQGMKDLLVPLDLPVLLVPLVPLVPLVLPERLEAEALDAPMLFRK
tara:strand:+ start:560 stop:763 length:204 start_codon:yes stop_codon:yes gene_type:complete